MTKTSKIILSITSIILGWFLCGFGFTTSIEHPLNTVCFLSGVGLFLVGSVFLIKGLTK
jgi:hypothetical protein